MKRKEHEKGWWIFVAYTESKISLDFQREDRPVLKKSHDEKVPDL